jgi:hypothetical protein
MILLHNKETGQNYIVQEVTAKKIGTEGKMLMKQE